MPTITSADINKIVSFNIYPASIIGTVFEKVKVLAILDADTVRAFGVDPQAMHVNVYPTLPVGTPNNYRSYSYLKVELLSGEPAIVGLPWINEATVVVHENVQMRVTVADVTMDDYKRLRNALTANGFNNFNIELL